MQWTDPRYRLAHAESRLARTYFGGEAFPSFDPEMGPGNLATFIGSEPHYVAETVWFSPCITDPENHPPLQFDPAETNFRIQMAIIEAALAARAGRYVVGLPDLIENVDTLVSLRGMETLLADMLDRPACIEERVAQVNAAWFAAYDCLYARVKDEWGGSTWACFFIWGEGKTAKLQCDASATFSPAMLRRFVVPGITAQCRYLDNSLYHLDGMQCLVHLDELLSIDELDAIQWTAGAGRALGGDPQWYDLYRRILAGGKCVMAVEVKPREVVPLLDAVGPQGMFIKVEAESEEEARALEEKVEAYR